MVRAKDRESNTENSTMLVDVSKAVNSAQALRILEEFVSAAPLPEGGAKVDLNSGSLLLTGRVLSKINDLLRQYGSELGIVYATLPQTQQSALDCGFFVKERPPGVPAPRIRTPLNPVSNPHVSAGSVDSLVDQFKEQFSERFAEQFPGFSPETPRQPAPRSQEASLPFGDTMAMDPQMFSPVLERIQPSAPPKPAEEIVAQPPVAEESLPTLYWKNTLRSGQVVRYEGNLVIVGDVHGGSEISATGSILVWGELRGIAHAGAGGNRHAEIRALKIEAIQLRIADVIARRPDRIYYHKDPEDGLAMPMPEVARVDDGEIKIFNDVIGR